jgi:hypothetical protein
VESYHHPKIVEIGTSMFRSAIFVQGLAYTATKNTHQEERLHLILMSNRDLIDVDDRRISAARNPTMSLDCLEYTPPVVAVTLISREAERGKQRFDGLRSARL